MGGAFVFHISSGYVDISGMIHEYRWIADINGCEIQGQG